MRKLDFENTFTSFLLKFYKFYGPSEHIGIIEVEREEQIVVQLRQVRVAAIKDARVH